MGATYADIGMIMGYAGKNLKDWVKTLIKKYPDAKEAVRVGKALADINLVSKAYIAAVGYDYEEKYFRTVKIKGEDGECEMDYVPYSKSCKHAKPSSDLIKFLLPNRMPEYFRDVKYLEIDKRSVEFKGDINKEIASFFGKLTDIAKERKRVGSEIVENGYAVEEDQSTNDITETGEDLTNNAVPED